MASGVVTFSLARAKVTSDGEVLAKSATVTVQGGEAVAIDRSGGVELRMRGAVVSRTRKSAIIEGEDGTTWEVARLGCGCGAR
jgi:hypothetical protein